VNQKFTGQERDAETGLDYFHARYFSAALGRFNSPDPGNAGASLFNPQSWNAYTYVFNNPLTNTDPTGLCTFDGDGNAVGDEDGPCYSGGSGGSATVDGGAIDSLPIIPFFYCCSYVTGELSGPVERQKPARDFRPSASMPPNTGSPLPPQIQACDSAILNAVNTKFKTSFTDTNVTRRFQFSTGAPDGQGTLNLNISVPAAMQPTKVAVGRYPVNPATYILGAGATLHIPPGPGGADSPLTLPFNASQFTAHLDSALPYNPIGLLTHLLQDMSSLGGYKPCP
jgi:RHS repeat-associated protein